MIIVLAAAYIILSRTCFGRYIYAVGSNAEVAKLSGINVKKIKYLVYIICGILAALGGVVLSSKLQSGQPNAAQSYELNASRRSPWAAQACRADAAASFRPYSALSPSASSTTL